MTTDGQATSRNPSPLPGKDLITLCEAVTWLATGKARRSEVVRRLMRRHAGGRQPRELWAEMEGAADRLVSLARSGKLKVYGSVDDAGVSPIPLDYFAIEVFAEFAFDIIAPDPLAFAKGSYQPGLPTYRSVRFFRSDLLAAVPTPAGPNRLPGNVPTDGRETLTDQQIERFYKSFDEIADRWSVENHTPGTKGQIYKDLVRAMCDGAFFGHGLAVATGALIAAISEDEAVTQDKTLPAGEVVRNGAELLGYFAPLIADELGLTLASDPDAFFAWLKKIGLDRGHAGVRQVLDRIVVSKPAFRNWCVDNGTPLPRFLSSWEEEEPSAAEPLNERPERSRPTTIAARNRCQEWLEGLMTKGPQVMAKDQYRELSVERFGISSRQFGIAWTTALSNIRNPTWGKSGRRRLLR